MRVLRHCHVIDLTTKYKSEQIPNFKYYDGKRYCLAVAFSYCLFVFFVWPVCSVLSLNLSLKNYYIMYYRIETCSLAKLLFTIMHNTYKCFRLFQLWKRQITDTFWLREFSYSILYMYYVLCIITNMEFYIYICGNTNFQNIQFHSLHDAAHNTQN